MLLISLIKCAKLAAYGDNIWFRLFFKSSKLMFNLFEVVFYCLLRIGDAVRVSRYRKIIVTKINQ